jgi:hypothetical protein
MVTPAEVGASMHRSWVGTFGESCLGQFALFGNADGSPAVDWRFLSLTEVPLPAPLMAKLRHPAGGQLEFLRRRLSAMAQSQKSHDSAVAWTQRAKERGKVELERDLIRDGPAPTVLKLVFPPVQVRLTVGATVELIVSTIARTRQRLDSKAALTLSGEG